MNKRINDFEEYGFTLIEVLAALVIISILVVIAVPQYRQQQRESQRAAVQSQMLQLAGDLERWRSKALSYQGFVPSSGYGTTGTVSNTTIMLPIGSTTSNYQYIITLVDSTNRALSLVATSSPSSVGLGWTMIARPNSGSSNLTDDAYTSTGFMGSASRVVLDSRGVRCMTPGTFSDHITNASIINMTITDAGLCGSTSVTW